MGFEFIVVQKLRKIEEQSPWTQVRKLCALIKGLPYTFYVKGDWEILFSWEL